MLTTLDREQEEYPLLLRTRKCRSWKNNLLDDLRFVRARRITRCDSSGRVRESRDYRRTNESSAWISVRDGSKMASMDEKKKKTKKKTTSIQQEWPTGAIVRSGSDNYVESAKQAKQAKQRAQRTAWAFTRAFVVVDPRTPAGFWPVTFTYETHFLCLARATRSLLPGLAAAIRYDGRRLYVHGYVTRLTNVTKTGPRLAGTSPPYRRNSNISCVASLIFVESVGFLCPRSTSRGPPPRNGARLTADSAQRRRFRKQVFHVRSTNGSDR